jgi:hypothetical protein
VYESVTAYTNCKSFQWQQWCTYLIYIYIKAKVCIWLDVFVCMLLGSGGLLLCSGGVFFGVRSGGNDIFDTWLLLCSRGVFFGVRSGSITWQRLYKIEPFLSTLHVNLYIFTNNGRTMTMTNDRPDLPSEGSPIIDKTILVNVNRNKYQVVRPSWALKPGLTDRQVVGRKVTLTLRERLEEAQNRSLWRTQFGRGYGPVPRQINTWTSNFGVCSGAAAWQQQ